MDNVPAEILDFLKTGYKFIVAGHKEPDGDCIGSQLALGSILKRLGKNVIQCSSGPFKRTEIKKYENLFCPNPDSKMKQDARVIITDCSSAERMGDLADLLKGLPTALIDHHTRGIETPAHNGPVFINSEAPSVTFMILKLADTLGIELTAVEAELLLFGLCTDTGFFRHEDSNSAETFEAAARFIRAGASPKKTFQAINGGKSLDSRHLLARILGRAESFFNGKLIVSSEELEETRQFGPQGKDSDTLYQLIQSIEGVEAIVIIRQENPENCVVGLRSKDNVDVSAIARFFNGGGHKNAAGAVVPGTIAEIKKKILEIFQLHLS